MAKERKLSEYLITRDLGRALCQRLLGACIRDLQRMQESLLLGECSGLRSVWDEICVQQQWGLSFSWQAYLDTMVSLIEYRVSELKPYEVDALWLLTQEADDWDSEPEDEREPYPVFRLDVVAYLQQDLLNQATNWSNARISRHLAQLSASD